MTLYLNDQCRESLALAMIRRGVSSTALLPAGDQLRQELESISARDRAVVEGMVLGYALREAHLEDEFCELDALDQGDYLTQPPLFHMPAQSFPVQAPTMGEEEALDPVPVWVGRAGLLLLVVVCAVALLSIIGTPMVAGGPR